MSGKLAGANTAILSFGIGNMLALPARLRRWARNVKRDLYAVYLASRDPRVPWHAKALALGVTGYALSPLDLIPDVIPVLGYVDDAIILPLGIWLVVKLIPKDVMAEHRAAADRVADLPRSMTAAIVIVTIWFVVAAGTAWFAYRFYSN
jgi:uncharacterized membrane protein YkvA (DUF1232 family)